MRTLNGFDLTIHLLIGLVGFLSAYISWNLWLHRNGGIFTRALCAGLLTAGLLLSGYSAVEFIVWHQSRPVFRFPHDAYMTLLSLFAAVHCWILMYVIPRVGKKG